MIRCLLGGTPKTTSTGTRDEQPSLSTLTDSTPTDLRELLLETSAAPAQGTSCYAAANSPEAFAPTPEPSWDHPKLHDPAKADTVEEPLEFCEASSYAHDDPVCDISSESNVVEAVSPPPCGIATEDAAATSTDKVLSTTPNEDAVESNQPTQDRANSQSEPTVDHAPRNSVQRDPEDDYHVAVPLQPSESDSDSDSSDDEVILPQMCRPIRAAASETSSDSDSESSLSSDESATEDEYVEEPEAEDKSGYDPVRPEDLVEQPFGFRDDVIILKHQLEAPGWMDRHEDTFGGGILADEPGCGKTVTMACFLLYIKEQYDRANGLFKGNTFDVCTVQKEFPNGIAAKTFQRC